MGFLMNNNPENTEDKADIQFEFAPVSTTTTKKNITPVLTFMELDDYQSLYDKLNEVIQTTFKKGPQELGKALASIHYHLFEQSEETQKVHAQVGLSYVNEILRVYIPLFQNPYNYSLLLHQYILSWVKLIFILDASARDYINILSPKDTRLEPIYNYKLVIDQSDKLFPFINPEIPILKIHTEDEEFLHALCVNYNIQVAGAEFAKYYLSILKKILYEKEDVHYMMQIQSAIGPIVTALSSSAPVLFLEGVGKEYYGMNKNLKYWLKQLLERMNDKDLHFLRKKFIYQKFEGTTLSDVLSLIQSQEEL